MVLLDSRHTFVHEDGCDVAAAGGEPAVEDVGGGWVKLSCRCGTRHVRVDGGRGDPPPRPEWHSHGARPCPDAPAGVVVERSVTGEYWNSRCGHGFTVPWWPADRRVPFGGVPSPFQPRPAGVAS